jgi:hypothetical protein
MTTLLQYSPAPWRVLKTAGNEYRLEIVDDEGFTVAVLDASDEAMGAMDDDVRLRPDAHLVAAAPRLYSACKALLAENDELRRMLADRTGITHTVHAAREEAFVAIADAEAGASPVPNAGGGK